MRGRVAGREYVVRVCVCQDALVVVKKEGWE